MPLEQPKTDRTYWFVRVVDGRTDWLAYQRYEDGSATTASDDAETIWECDDCAWRMALDQITTDGFILRDDALESGVISADDLPPAELQAAYGIPG